MYFLLSWPISSVAWIFMSLIWSINHASYREGSIGLKG